MMNDPPSQPRPVSSELMPIGVLTNLHARCNRKGRFHADRLQSILGSHGLVQECREVEQVGDVVAKFKQLGVKVIGVNGGDGTWGRLLTEVLRQYSARELPLFLPLRGGTMNMLADELGLRGNPASLLAHLVAFLKGRAEAPQVQTVKTLQVDVSDQPLRQHGFVWANGMAYQFLREYYARGPASFGNALITTVSLIAGAPFPTKRSRRAWQPSRAKIIIDGQELAQEEFRISVASTLSALVLWFTPFGQGVGDLEQGFGFMLNRLSVIKTLRHLWAVSRGRLQHPNHFSRVVEHVRIVTRGGFVLDGEMFNPAGEVQIDLCKGQNIRVLKPSPGPKIFP